MRKIVNISLPEELDKLVEKEIKKGHFASKSEFFRGLIKRWQEEQLLVEELEKSREEFRSGKVKILHSLSDLD